MSKSHETIADIAAEKRRIAKEIRDHASNGDYWDKKRANETAEDLEEEADRLEAAHKRDRGDGAKLPKTVDTRFDICKNIALVLKIGRDYQGKDGYRGAHYDTVKLLCDAIEYQQEQLKTKTAVGDAAKLREALERIAHYTDNRDGMDDPYCADGHILADIAKEALKEPIRNCDVGTAEEQSRRFEEYCESEVCKRNRCKSQAKALCIERCALAWAQMPYEEGGNK